MKRFLFAVLALWLSGAALADVDDGAVFDDDAGCYSALGNYPPDFD